MTDQRLTPQEEQELRQRWDASLPQTLPYPTPTAIARQAQEDVPKLLAEIDRLRGESQRRDMSSAPKDGTEVVLWVKARAGIPHCCLVGHYMRGGHCIEDHPAIDEGWYFWNGCMFDRAAEPIAWMPLPAAPDATVPPRPQEDRERRLQAWAGIADEIAAEASSSEQLTADDMQVRITGRPEEPQS